jgi:hypothetical protein
MEVIYNSFFNIIINNKRNMLSKATLHLKKSTPITRSFKTVTQYNYVVPETMDEVVKYLDKHRPTYTLLYFTAKWNPMIPSFEKDY